MPLSNGITVIGRRLEHILFESFPEQVTTKTKASDIILEGCHFECGDIALPAAKIRFVHDDEFALSILLPDGQLTLSSQLNAIFNNDEATLESPLIAEPIKLFTTGGGESGLQLIPKCRPIAIGTENPVVKIQALIINGPDLGALSLTHNLATISYQKAVGDGDHASSSARISGYLEITFDAPQDTKEACKYLDGFVRFLTLLKGSRTGAGSVYGYSIDEKVNFLRVGFSGFDEAKTPVGWFDSLLTKSLPEIYEKYSEYVTEHTRPLLKTIEYYRAANVIQESSCEMAVISSHGALELIVHHILEIHGGWGKSLMSNRDIKFGDKSRAAFTLIRCNADPLEHSPRLQAFARARSNLDAFDIVSLFRNKLTHNDPKFSYDGMELFEVWNVSQWLCEMFLFYCLKYRGKALDRRRYGGWTVGPEELKFD